MAKAFSLDGDLGVGGFDWRRIRTLGLVGGGGGDYPMMHGVEFGLVQNERVVYQCMTCALHIHVNLGPAMCP